MKAWHVIAAAVLVTACATAPAPIPEEAEDAEGVAGATAKMTFAKWLGSLILQAVTNTTVKLDIQIKQDGDGIIETQQQNSKGR